MNTENIVKPTKEQAEWADLEIGVIIHLDMQTFESSYNFRDKWGYQPSAKLFNPLDLDTDKWILTAKSAGAKYAVLVAKHCSGFCLWNTDTHEYSVKNSPWKKGQGDVVRDFFDSCKKYDVKPGLYYSASCNAYMDVDNPGIVRSKDPIKQKEYNDMVIAQLTELWTRYGDVFEIWFDGGCLPVEQGGPDIVPLLHKLQPNAVVFQGPIGTKSLLRWVGNEKAIAPEDCFATVDFTPESFDGSDERIYSGNPYGDTWSPAESDMPNRDASKAYMGGWFWREGEEDFIIPSESIYDTYFKSVGRNTNLLIGMVIDDKGQFPAKDTDVFKKFGEMVNDTFKNCIARFDLNTITDENAYEYKILLPENSNASFLVLMEDIKQGERILSYTINNSIHGKSIGHKHIIPINNEWKEIIVKINEAKNTPCIREISVY